MPSPSPSPTRNTGATVYQLVQFYVREHDGITLPTSFIQPVADHVCQMLAAGDEPEKAEFYADGQAEAAGYGPPGWDFVQATGTYVCQA